MVGSISTNILEWGGIIVTVVDGYCGIGKTSWAIQYINSLSMKSRVLFITPFLSECERITKSCISRNFLQPNTRYGKGSKLNNLIDLIRDNRNIVSTHALFGNLDSRVIKELKSKNYILIIDEAVSMVEKVNLYANERNVDLISGEAKTTEDIKTLLNRKILSSGDDDFVTWDNESENLYKYKLIKKKANEGSLFFVDDDLVMWSFPSNVFSSEVFSDIYILTYQFDSQIQYYYFKYYGIEFTTKTIYRSGNKYSLVDYSNDYDKNFRCSVKEKIKICENQKLNDIGSYFRDSSGKRVYSALSSSWYDKSGGEYETIKNNMVNYWRHIVKSESKYRMWTCLKKHKDKFYCNDISKKNFVSINARATNDFSNKKYLCYMANRYLNPCFVRFFAQRGVYVDQDKFALAEMIQWIWRSAIRNGETIYIYIPSERMRTLLKNWLDI